MSTSVQEDQTFANTSVVIPGALSTVPVQMDMYFQVMDVLVQVC